jgi:flagellar protein FlaJ
VYFEQKYRITVWAVSSCIGILILVTPVLLGLYTPESPYLIPLSQKVNNTMALGLVLMFFFPAIVEFNNYKRGRQVDRNIPRLLRDITEAVRSGVTLPRAFEDASQRDYGPISKELESTMSMFILGASWEESLMSLAQRLRRPSALRLSTILVEAHQGGGKMLDVLEASVDLFSSLGEYKEEQYSNMRPYIMTIYMATVIFLIIARVVLSQFLIPLNETATSTTLGPAMQDSGLLSSMLPIEYYTSILFWASIVESIFGGLIAGKIADRTLSAGLRHSVLLTVVSLAFFNVPGF